MVVELPVETLVLFITVVPTIVDGVMYLETIVVTVVDEPCTTTV